MGARAAANAHEYRSFISKELPVLKASVTLPTLKINSQHPRR